MALSLALPPLRDELAVLPGPPGQDGAPSWTLHDPLSNRFFRLAWPAFEVLTRWHLGDPHAVAEAVSRETTLAMEPEDIAEVVDFLARSQLLRAGEPGAVDRLVAMRDAQESSWLTWLLHHYLFFRIPLLRPDAVLEAMLPWTAWAGGPAFRLATLAALLAGVFLVGRQWEVFAATFVDRFSMAGLAAFGLALGVAKIVHELGHALTARHFGCRVPTMGVAFLVLWPMLYTDVNESWKLTERRQRLLISGAGILAELTLAAWATLAWGLLPPGAAREMAFTLAATTWISSLAINLSPFMRFDGYFLAMDALDKPNLHPRSFALARWWLREVLFSLREPAPEPLPAATRAGMIAFAVAVWLYRLTLFLGIAVLVYHFFIKLVGVVLFAVEIGWFVAAPIAAELAAWHRRLPAIRASRRSRIPLAVLAAGLLLLAVPWSGRVSAPAILKAETRTVLYAPAPAMLAGVEVAEGQRVEAGTVLARLDNPDLALKLAQSERRTAVLRYELSNQSFDEGFRSRSRAIAEELLAAQAETAALAAERARLTLAAGFAGTVADLSPLLQPGQWVGPREPILAVLSGTLLEVYVAEADLPRLAVGAAARFIPEGGGGVAVQATVAAIDRVAVRALAEPSLAVAFGGTIPTRASDKALVPEQAIYRVRLAVASAAGAPAVPLRGEALMDGERRSLLGRVLRAAAAVVIREWGM